MVHRSISSFQRGTHPPVIRKEAPCLQRAQMEQHSLVLRDTPRGLLSERELPALLAFWARTVSELVCGAVPAPLPPVSAELPWGPAVLALPQVWVGMNGPRATLSQHWVTMDDKYGHFDPQVGHPCGTISQRSLAGLSPRCPPLNSSCLLPPSSVSPLPDLCFQGAPPTRTPCTPSSAQRCLSGNPAQDIRDDRCFPGVREGVGGGFEKQGL